MLSYSEYLLSAGKTGIVVLQMRTRSTDGHSKMLMMINQCGFIRVICCVTLVHLDTSKSGFPVTSLLSQWNADGVFIDDTLLVPVSISGGKWPANYPNRAAWEAAMMSFANAV